ncbi:MAG: glycosyltransferase [Lachnospiraceae bacterium]|nr:glycosyltransferase [Lachnospiraceae bacterium]
MKVLYITWEAFGGNDVRKELDRRGYEVDEHRISRKENAYSNQRVEQELIGIVSGKDYGFVFSWNFFPVVSIACNVCKVPYAAWVYDSPLMSLWHCTVVSPYNYIFIFDKADYMELKKKGINTVYYLPLAADVERYDSYKMDEEIEEVYSIPISFVGSTYSENRYKGYRGLNLLDDYTKGYIDGLVQTQKRIYGNLIMEDMLTPDIVSEMRKIYAGAMYEDCLFSYEKYFGQVLLAQWITSMERQEILSLLSERYPCYLYTHKKTPSLPHIINRGTAAYRKESCYIFRCSKINLNITLRSIRTGIPLRAFEIMGSGGFLLTNYQTDFLDYFEPGVDFAYYDSYEDLLQKTEYYLTHEEERQAVAKNGYEKVKKYHTYQNRFDAMLETMKIG